MSLRKVIRKFVDEAARLGFDEAGLTGKGRLKFRHRESGVLVVGSRVSKDPHGFQNFLATLRHAASQGSPRNERNQDGQSDR